MAAHQMHKQACIFKFRDQLLKHLLHALGEAEIFQRAIDRKLSNDTSRSIAPKAQIAAFEESMALARSRRDLQGGSSAGTSPNCTPNAKIAGCTGLLRDADADCVH